MVRNGPYPMTGMGKEMRKDERRGWVLPHGRPPRWVRAAVACLLCVAAIGTAYADVGGTLSATGGSADGDGVVSLGGRLEVSSPQGRGFQLEALSQHIGDTDFNGLGGHLFRDSGAGRLIGLFAGAGRYEAPDAPDADLVLAGLEGQLLLGRLRLTGQLGGVDVDPGNTRGLAVADAIWLGDRWTLGAGAGSVADAEWFYGEGAVRLYGLGSDTWAYAGLVGGDSDTVYGGVDWRPDSSARWSLFAEVASGEDSYDHLLAGVRLYFGRKIAAPTLSLFDPVTGAVRGIVPASNMRMDAMMDTSTGTSGGRMRP